MPNPKVITQVAAHDAANRKAADEAAEEAELQSRIARTLKPAQGVEPSTAPVMATPSVAASLVENTPEISAVVDDTAKAPVVPATMPDGTPIKKLTREDRLEIALKNLVAKLEVITQHEDWQKVWKSALAAGVVYEGPLWKPEVDFAKTLLK